jgi:hypothetical protein
MFGQIASTEPRQQWLRGDGAWASACAGSFPCSSILGTKVNDLGTGRRCP